MLWCLHVYLQCSLAVRVSYRIVDTESIFPDRAAPLSLPTTAANSTAHVPDDCAELLLSVKVCIIRLDDNSRPRLE